MPPLRSHPDPTPSLRARRVPALAAFVLALAVLLAGCNGDGGGDATATPAPSETASATELPTSPPGTPEDTTPFASPTPEAGGEPGEDAGATPAGGTAGSTGAGGSAPPTATPDAQQRLRTHLLSSLTTQADPSAVRAALDEIEVIALEFPWEERMLWLAVTSGSGIWSLPEERAHVAAIYDLRADGAWVEVSSVALASAPTLTDPEMVASDHAGSAWFAVHGGTGAHSGTFEVLRFDGVALTSALWWFSPMPGAGSLVDLDGDATPEVVLNATDPYVYCYACGVRLWSEVVYRWQDGDLMEVPLAGVAHADPLVAALTEQAAAYAHADLWRQASEAASLALDHADGDESVWWLHLVISRITGARQADAGAPAQPLVTQVFAGEYAAAVNLMRLFPPAEALSVDGPLIAGTAAEDGWEEATGDYLVDFATRALDADPTLAPAFAVRAFGRLLLAPEDTATALLDMEQAQALEPDDAFYREAVEYLTAQSAG